MIEDKKDNLRILYASEGMKLTNSERSFFSDFIYLGKYDTLDNYEEVGREIWKHFIEEENPDIDELKEQIQDSNNSIMNLEDILLDTDYRLTCIELYNFDEV